MILLMTQEKDKIINFGNLAGIEIKRTKKECVIQAVESMTETKMDIATYETEQQALSVMQIIKSGIERKSKEGFAMLEVPTPEELPKALERHKKRKRLEKRADEEYERLLDKTLREGGTMQWEQ